MRYLAIGCAALFAVASLRIPAAEAIGIGEPFRAARAGAEGDAYPFVIHVSVDGLRGDAVQSIGPRALPHFYRLRIEGAFTDNARTDFDYTITLPNHTCELTGRPVLGPDGHGVSVNSDTGVTIDSIHGSYVAGAFDVAHDAGLTTGMYSSKSKFALFDRSWNEANGGEDTTGVDDGRDKIDVHVYQASTAALIDSFVARMTAAPQRYAFIHLVDPDAVGHASGWESAAYLGSIVKVDSLLGRILGLIDSDERLADRTFIVLTADHGGTLTDHGDASNPVNYTVPLYVWGPAIPAGADLYRLNAAVRAEPGIGRPPTAASPPPIRNGEAANLSLDLLGLPAVPGSFLDAAQDCDAILPGGAGALPSIAITSPLPGLICDYPAAVTIEAAVDPRGGAIVRVEFYADGVLLGSDAASPYAYTWAEMPFGSYRLTARAVRDDSIAAAASVGIEIVSIAGEEEGHSFLRAPMIYPNPFSRRSTIEFSLAETVAVAVDVYDPLGRRVDRLFGGRLGEGVHAMTFDAADCAPGVYFLKLRSGGAVRTGKLTVVR